MKATVNRGGATSIFASVLAACLLLAACDRAGLPDRPPQPGDRAVARVNGHAIWTSEVQRFAVTNGVIREGAPLDPSSDVFRQMLQELIDQRLMATESLRRGLDRDPIVQRRMDAARTRILADLLVERVVSGAVSENAIRGLYNEQVILSRQSEEYRARQIVLRTLPEANQVRTLLAAGGAFETLAMERSTDLQTRYNGGDLGYFNTDLLGPPYAAALRQAHAGDLVGPFQTDQGWVVMRVEDRRQEQAPSLAVQRPQIIRYLTYDQIRDLLERLRAGARIENLLGPEPNLPGQPREPASAPRPGQLPAAPEALPAPSSTAGPGTTTTPAPPAATASQPAHGLPPASAPASPATSGGHR